MDGRGAAVLRAPVSARTGRELVLWLSLLVLLAVGLVLVLLAAVSVVLTVAVVGLVPLVLALLLARPLGRALRAILRAVGRLELPEPPLPRPAQGVRRSVRSVLTDPAGWRTLAYVAIAVPLAAVTVYATALLLVGGLFLVTCPGWWWIDHDGFGLLDVGPWGSSWAVVPAGVAALALFPWPMRVASRGNGVLARGLLAATGEQQRIAALERSRAQVAADAAATLRRVERDLHDATQGRLVTIGIAFARIADRLATPSPDRLEQARTLAAGGAASVEDGLAELRTIIDGIHPPVLDSGLAAALGTLGARAAVAVQLRTSGPDVTGDLAVTIYFCVAELLTNVVRHAGARGVRVEVDNGPVRLRVSVRDDGRGGADPARGSGLTGLRRRLDAVDGELTVHSPAGGPTTIVATVRHDRQG